MAEVKMNGKHFSKPSYQRRLVSSQVEKVWLALAQQRLDDIINKKVKTIPWDVVRKRIDQQLSK
ncbi:MAG: addiction module protein [Methylotenera sp.]|nr:addiction module protein [Methylotenera sp.]